MKRLALSIAVGIACAILLTLMRGGWRDAPYVVPVFAIVGFSMTYGITAVIQAKWIGAIQTASSGHRRWQLIRDAGALLLVGSLLFWSGPVIQQAGFGGWLVALFLGVVLPLFVCLLASRLPIVFGLLAATALAISILISSLSFRQDLFARDTWDRFLERGLGVWAIIWCVLAGLSLLVSVPIALRRRSVSRHGIE